MQIGDVLYTYDTNRRHYYNDDGTKRQYPNPAHYWREHRITGETRASWELDGGKYKADKRTLELRGIREFYALDRYAYTAEQKAEKLWFERHQRTIVTLVERANVATLREIAAILGFNAD